MTPEQQLRQAFLASDAEAGRKASGKRGGGKRADRQDRAAAGFAQRMLIRLALVLLSLGGSALMLFTEQGRQVRGEFQAAVLQVIETELAARRGAQMATAEGTTAQTEDDSPSAEDAPTGITWFAARGAEQQTNGALPKVSQMPESRVAIRRAGQGG